MREREQIDRDEAAIRQAIAQANQTLRNVLQVSICSQFGDDRKADVISTYIVRECGLREPQQIQAAVQHLIGEARKRISTRTPVIDKVYYMILKRLHGDYDR